MIEKILKNKNLFVPFIFTNKQFNILKKRNNLSNAEKKAFYTSIKKKLRALDLLEEKRSYIYIKGEDHIIKQRISLAENILKKYSEKNIKAAITGSFLFSKDYNDIDIFIIRKKGYKEETKDNTHLIYISEKKLKDPVFQSALKISISNFFINPKTIYKKQSLHNMMSKYHEAVIEILEKKEKKEAVRDLIFTYNKSNMNGLELKEKEEKAKIDDIDKFYKNILKNRFSKNYLYNELLEYNKTIENSIMNIKRNEHLKHYKKIYEEILYGNKTKAKAH